MKEYVKEAPPTSTRDWLTSDGAHALARKIRHYWAEKGYAVNTTITKVSGHGKDLYAITSDMKNGVPTARFTK